MDFNLDASTAVLERTPTTLLALLGDLPETWTHASEGPETWSPYDVLGHFIHGENTDWLPRLRIILEHGERRTFDPFVRDAMFEYSAGKSMQQLLDEFATARAENIHKLRELDIQPAQYTLIGTHPEFGPVTIAQLIATWTAHDLGHIVQIARTMARQYRAAVGPWTKYLNVMG
jgi:hypothetical protein